MRSCPRTKSNARAVFFPRPVSYRDGVDIQERLHQARLDDRISDTVLLLEHTPVVTLGTRGRSDGLLLPPETYAARGIDLVRSSRGGDATFHGPGQAVIYPILKLGGSEADSHGYLFNLEEIALRTCADFGVKAWRREGKNGAWTDAGKIAAIGFRLKRWVTLHGMSFNVDPDPAGFQTIVPCGLVGESVGSLRQLLGSACPGVRAVQECLARQFAGVCGRPLEWLEADGPLPPELNGIIRLAEEPRSV